MHVKRACMSPKLQLRPAGCHTQTDRKNTRIVRFLPSSTAHSDDCSRLTNELLTAAAVAYWMIGERWRVSSVYIDMYIIAYHNIYIILQHRREVRGWVGERPNYVLKTTTFDEAQVPVVWGGAGGSWGAGGRFVNGEYTCECVSVYTMIMTNAIIIIIIVARYNNNNNTCLLQLGIRDIYNNVCVCVVITSPQENARTLRRWRRDRKMTTTIPTAPAGIPHGIIRIIELKRYYVHFPSSLIQSYY